MKKTATSLLDSQASNPSQQDELSDKEEPDFLDNALNDENHTSLSCYESSNVKKRQFQQLYYATPSQSHHPVKARAELVDAYNSASADSRV